MITQELKERAIRLRRDGASYNLIYRETGITKGTLSDWFSDSNWSEDTLLKNKASNLEESRKRIILMNQKRMSDLVDKYNKIEEEASREFERFKNESLFVAALMLYLGEGSKLAKHSSVRISNTDVAVLKIFINFVTKYCNIPLTDVRFWLLSYPDINHEKCLEWWIRGLNLSRNNLYKTQVIEGKHKTKRLLYGVGNIIIPLKILKIKILKWIELMSIELT